MNLQPPPLYTNEIELPYVTHLIEDAVHYAHQSPHAEQHLGNIMSGFVSNLKHLLSTRSIALLPTEVLCECFSYACAVDPHSSPPLPYKVIMDLTALAIASVCQRWRAIILDMPHAWACIDVTFIPRLETPRDRNGMMLANTIRLYVERSLISPLSIRLKVPSHSRDHTTHLTRMVGLSFFFIVPYLLPHMARWRHVTLDFPNQRLPTFVLPIPDSPTHVVHLPMLETLSLDYLRIDTSLSPFLNAVAAAPQLQHLKFKGKTNADLMERLQLQREGNNCLKTVVLDDLAYSSLTTAVERLFKVNKLAIVCPRYPSGLDPERQGYRPTTLRVKELVVVFREDSRGGPGMLWVGSLDLPKLSGLELIHLFPTSLPDDNTSRILIDLFVRSRVAASMRQLVLKGVVMWASELVDVLTTVPQLEELILHEPVETHCVPVAFRHNVEDISEEPHMISETFCMRLALDEVVPKLEKLELVWACEMSVDAVLDMVEERKGLTEVGLGTLPARGFDARCMERLNNLKEEGRSCFILPA